jgi:HEAT repeat protein
LRLAAAESIGKLGDNHAIPKLLDIIDDDREKSLYLKESAAKALGMLGDLRALEPLIDILESKQGFFNKFNFLKEQLIESIGRIGHGGRHRKATDSLIRALEDEAPSIRLAAVEALSGLGDPSCIPEIEKLLMDDELDVAFAAIHCIFQLGGEPEMKRLRQLDTLRQIVRDELESYIP